MKNKLPYIVGGVGFVIVAALIIFLVVRSVDNNSNNSADNLPVNEQVNDQVNDQDSVTSGLAEGTSEPADGANPADVNSVGLLEQNVSFFLPTDITEVTSGQTDIYKKYTSVRDCLYVGQDSTGSGRESGELVVAVYETEKEDDCLNDNVFSENPSINNVAGYTTTLTQLEGNSGSVLLLEKTSELGNGVSMAFFYKEKYSVNVRPEIESILESFEIEG